MLCQGLLTDASFTTTTISNTRWYVHLGLSCSKCKRVQSSPITTFQIRMLSTMQHVAIVCHSVHAWCVCACVCACVPTRARVGVCACVPTQVGALTANLTRQRTYILLPVETCIQACSKFRP